MVHVADNSFCGFNYREINQQLARDNGELRQQLSQAVNENSLQREEIHKKDVEILDLKRQLKELATYKQKFIAIKEIVIDTRRSIQSVNSPNKAIQSTVDAIQSCLQDESNLTPVLPMLSSRLIDNQQPSPSTESASASQTLDENILHRISERSEEDEEVKESEKDSYHSPLASVETLSSRPNTSSVADSLCPPNVTSVPPLRPENTMHTPSIWNCLDTLDDIKDDMFQSTPIGCQTKGQRDQTGKAKRGRGRPRGKGRPAASREVKYDEVPNEPNPPTRYNLRKRTKV